jgi:Fic family protein
MKMTFLPDKPFNDLPTLPPKAEVETKAILKKAISAGRALAELKGLGETIPNQSILVNSIILQEAKASSEIENIGILQLHKIGKENLYLNKKLFELLSK